MKKCERSDFATSKICRRHWRSEWFTWMSSNSSIMANPRQNGSRWYCSRKGTWSRNNCREKSYMVSQANRLFRFFFSPPNVNVNFFCCCWTVYIFFSLFCVFFSTSHISRTEIFHTSPTILAVNANLWPRTLLSFIPKASAVGTSI